MKKILALIYTAFLFSCLSPTTDENNSNSQNSASAGAFKKGKDTRPSCIIFYTNLNNNLLDEESGNVGTMYSGKFDSSLFEYGVRKSDSSRGKFLIRYPNSDSLSRTPGTLEALVKYDGVVSSYSHIIDKSWQYSLSVHNGKLAAWTGSSWWYTNVKVPIGQWTYIALTWVDTHLVMYMNGEPLAFLPYAGITHPEYSTELPFGIGNVAIDGMDYPFNGTIDEIRVSRCNTSARDIQNTWRDIRKELKKDR